MQSLFEKTIFSDSPEDGSVNVWDGSRWVATASDEVGVQTPQLTTTIWQAVVPTNDGSGFANTDSLNDGISTYASASPGTAAVGETCPFLFSQAMKVKRWRQSGRSNNNGTGRWEIQYKNEADVWTTWQADIPTRTVATYGDWSYPSDITTTGIRLKCTTADTGTGDSHSDINELDLQGTW